MSFLEIVNLLALDRICRPPPWVSHVNQSGLQSFQTEAAVHHEFTKLKFCRDIMKNQFAIFGLKYNLLTPSHSHKKHANSLFKQKSWFITNSRNPKFAVVSRKIIFQLLASNKICRHPLPRKSGLQSFQTEAAVHLESTKLKFCHDFMKNHFAAFGWHPLSRKSGLQPFQTEAALHHESKNSWNWNYATVSRKSFCSFWPQNRICRHLFSQR